MKRGIKIGLFIFGILFVFLIVLNVYVNSKAKEEYITYYNRVCERQEITNLVAGGEGNTNEIALCKETGGCFNGCGSACANKQKYYIFDVIGIIKFLNPVKLCIQVCVPVCLCPYGKSFDIEGGCV